MTSAEVIFCMARSLNAGLRLGRPRENEKSIFSNMRSQSGLLAAATEIALLFLTHALEYCGCRLQAFPIPHQPTAAAARLRLPRASIPPCQLPGLVPMEGTTSQAPYVFRVPSSMGWAASRILVQLSKGLTSLGLLWHDTRYQMPRGS